jgi:hypothetical protein
VGKEWNPVLLWSEEPTPARYGPGISRPRDGQRAKPYKLLVRTANAAPMRVTLAAPTKRDAIRFAQNRWPGAAVEVLK